MRQFSEVDATSFDSFSHDRVIKKSDWYHVTNCYLCHIRLDILSHSSFFCMY